MIRPVSALAFLFCLGFGVSAFAQSNDYTGSITSLTRKAPDGKLSKLWTTPHAVSATSLGRRGVLRRQSRTVERGTPN